MNHSTRKYFTSLVAFSFLVVGGTGLYFKLFSKNHTLEEIHTWIGIIMVVAAIVHLIQNMKSMLIHLKQLKVYLLLIPIFIIILVFSLEGAKEPKGLDPKAISRKVLEAKIIQIAPLFNKSPEEIVYKIKNDGLSVSNSEQSLSEIARNNHQPPPKMFKYLN